TGLASRGKSRIPSDFPDGTSNTILFAERYADAIDGVTGLQRNNIWDHWDRYDEDMPGFVMRGLVGVPGNTDQLDGPGSKFQVVPNAQPIPGSNNNYSWRLAQTGHISGMTVALADGSGRILAPNISGTTWWAACTPKGGEVMGTDW